MTVDLGVNGVTQGMVGALACSSLFSNRTLDIVESFQLSHSLNPLALLVH